MAPPVLSVWLVVPVKRQEATSGTGEWRNRKGRGRWLLLGGRGKCTKAAGSVMTNRH